MRFTNGLMAPRPVQGADLLTDGPMCDKLARVSASHHPDRDAEGQMKQGVCDELGQTLCHRSAGRCCFTRVFGKPLCGREKLSDMRKLVD